MSMRAMVLNAPGERLVEVERDRPEPGAGQVLIRVHACGVCRTDLHVVDGELTDARLPIVPGHEIVGTVTAAGEGAERFAPGTRVGVPWLGHTCGRCRFCRTGRENLCDQARFTGYQLDGGYADYVVAEERYSFPVSGDYTDAEAAPLLCAGLIGSRALAMAGDGERLLKHMACILIQPGRVESALRSDDWSVEPTVYGAGAPEDARPLDTNSTQLNEGSGGSGNIAQINVVVSPNGKKPSFEAKMHDRSSSLDLVTVARHCARFDRFAKARSQACRHECHENKGKDCP